MGRTVFFNYILIAIMCCCGLQCALNFAGDVTETGNAAIITGIVTDKSNQPLANVKIITLQLSDNVFILPKPVDTITSDTDGSFSVTVMPNAHYALEIRSGDNKLGAVTLPLKADSGVVIELQEVVVNKLVTYNGHIICDNGIPVHVFFGGTLYRSIVDKQGYFSIKDVPQQEYSVLVEMRDSVGNTKNTVFAKKIDLGNGCPFEIDTVNVFLRILLLEDFEKADNVSCLWKYIGGSWWDAQNDDFEGGNSKLISPKNGSTTFFTNAINITGGYNNKSCLKVDYELGNKLGVEMKWSYVYVGINIGEPSTVQYDFSKLDSLCFYAKGNGKVYFDCVQHCSQLGIYISAGMTFTMTDEWKKYTVKPELFMIDVVRFPNNKNLATIPSHVFNEHKIPHYTKKPADWKSMEGKINMINFYCIEGNVLWLDDMKIFGMIPSDLKCM